MNLATLLQTLLAKASEKYTTIASPSKRVSSTDGSLKDVIFAKVLTDFRNFALPETN
jgi:hypothetical protein